MRIADEDRSLAHEIAELFGEETDTRLVRALAVVMASHRQLPADEQASGIQVPPGPCNNALLTGPGAAVIRCVLRAGHAGQHESSNASTTWGTMTRESTS